MSKDLTKRIHEMTGIDGTIPRTVFTPSSVYDRDIPDNVQIHVDQDTITLGYLTHDDDAGDFFEDDEGAGSYRHFKREDDPNEIMDAILRTGKIAFFVQRYSHGLDHYSVASSRDYPDQKWDVGICGIHTPCEDVQEAYRKLLESEGEEAARNYAVGDANKTLDSYSDACNGETYGAIVETWLIEGQHVRAIGRECSWGLLGQEHALETLKDMLPKSDESLELSM